MPKHLSPEIPLILAVVAQFLAVLAALWLIWPLRVGPVYYSEVSIVEVEGLGVLPMLFAPSALILGGTWRCICGLHGEPRYRCGGLGWWSGFC